MPNVVPSNGTRSKSNNNRSSNLVAESGMAVAQLKSTAFWVSWIAWMVPGCQGLLCYIERHWRHVLLWAFLLLAAMLGVGFVVKCAPNVMYWIVHLLPFLLYWFAQGSLHHYRIAEAVEGRMLILSNESTFCARVTRWKGMRTVRTEAVAGLAYRFWSVFPPCSNPQKWYKQP